MRWEIEDKVQLSPAEAEIRTELCMTENHSKHIVEVKFRHLILTLLFLVDLLLFWGGWGKLRIKSISVQLKLKLGLSLAINTKEIKEGSLESVSFYE